MSLFNLLVSRTIMHVPGPLVGYFARGYIAGEKLEDAIRVSRDMNRQGMLTTIDILGEFISTVDDATFFKDHCLSILDAIGREGLDSNLSLKPTQMGLLLDAELAYANIREILERATQLDNFVRIDMEDTDCTTATLDLYRRLRDEFPGHVGTVVQSYLRRTLTDVDELFDGQVNLRLCKGIYNEPRRLAYKDPQIVNRSFVACLERIFRGGGYVGIATHDEKLVFEALRLIREYGLGREDYEFQMLLGVDEELRRILVEDGHRLRVYVPFGEAWLPYSRRRLKENPGIARHALRQMLGFKPGG